MVSSSLSPVSVIVVNRDGAALLPTLLDSLERQTRAPDEVIVVDNGSRDASRERVRERNGRVRLVEVSRNRGAAEGRNLGTEAARGNVLVFVDNDSEADPAWIAEGLAALDRHPEWGAIGSLVYYDGNRELLNGCGGRLNRSLHGIDEGTGQPRASFAPREGPFLYAMSNGLFVRRAAAAAVGRWDPALFVYYEDVDFCLRLWLAGTGVGVAPRAVLYHKISGGHDRARPRRHFLSERHRLRLALKYLAAREWPSWLKHEGRGGLLDHRRFGRRALAALWAYNLLHLPSALAFRGRHRSNPALVTLRGSLDADWGMPVLPGHNLRPIGASATPVDGLDSRGDADAWLYGTYPTESLPDGEAIQWLDGDAATEVRLTRAVRRVSARLLPPPDGDGAGFQLRLRTAERDTWAETVRIGTGGWHETSWACAVEPGLYRFHVQGAPRLVEGPGGPRKLLVGYRRFDFLAA
jgi:GT2 family glycosyltransferase